MKRIVSMIVLGLLGLGVALGLTVGALAFAGNDVGDVVEPRPVPTAPRQTAQPTPSAGRHTASTPTATASASSTGGSDDGSHGGGDSSGHGSGDDSSGHGSGDGSSGSSSGSGGHSGDDD
jgi:hypothetical protein